MILNITGLGIVKNIRIDLNKNFIVFCGVNGTGKTYVSYILNAFLCCPISGELSFSTDLLTQIKEKNKFNLKKEYVEEWLIAKCKWVTENTGSVFGISDESTNTYFSDFKIETEFSDDDFNTVLTKKVTSPDVLFGFTMSDGVVSIDASNWLIPAESLNDRLQRIAINHIFKTIVFDSGVRMLTVERNSIYTFKTELSLSRNSLVEQMQQQAKDEQGLLNLIENKSRRYPLAINRSLRIANDLTNVQKSTSGFSDIADRIEKDMLAGEVIINGNGDVEFHDRGMTKNSKLPFHISSSIVKTMASLVIYLRHLAMKGDTLIIDEPEMNFHPNVQITLARIFAIMANRGIKIVISTHSDYVIREINNLIMAKQIKERGDDELINTFGYSDDMLLDYNQIGVYHFEKKSSKSVKTETVKLDVYGFAVASMDEAINEQNKISEQLTAKMYD